MYQYNILGIQTTATAVWCHFNTQRRKGPSSYFVNRTPSQRNEKTKENEHKTQYLISADRKHESGQGHELGREALHICERLHPRLNVWEAFLCPGEANQTAHILARITPDTQEFFIQKTDLPHVFSVVAREKKKEKLLAPLLYGCI